MQLLPFKSNVPHDRFSTTLDGSMYSFAVNWNHRDEAWYFDVFDEQSAAIARGVKIVLGAYLGRGARSRHALFRDGAFVAHDLSGANLDAGWRDLGTRVVVVYYTQSDLAAALEFAA